MPLMEGTRGLKEWKGSYDFAVDGGDHTAAVVLRSDDGPIPNGSVIEGGYLEVTTALNSGGSATAAIQVNAANDIITATAFGSSPWSSTGRKSVIPAFTGATTVKTTAARSPELVIAVADLTDGVFNVILYFR